MKSIINHISKHRVVYALAGGVVVGAALAVAIDRSLTQDALNAASEAVEVASDALDI